MTVLAKFKLNDEEMIVARSYEMDYRISDLGDYGNDLAVFAKTDKIVMKTWCKALVVNALFFAGLVSSIGAFVVLAFSPLEIVSFTAPLLVFLLFVLKSGLIENSFLSIVKIPFNYLRILTNKNALYSYAAHCYSNSKNGSSFHSDQSWMLLDMEEISRKYLFHKPETINDIEKYVNTLNNNEKQQFFVDGLIAGQINSRIYNLEQTLSNSGYGMNALKNDVNKEIAKLQKESAKYEAKRKHHTVRLINAEVNETLVNELSINSQFAA